MMWEYNFDDYKLFCELKGLKPCKYASLEYFKEFVNWCIDEYKNKLNEATK